MSALPSIADIRQRIEHDCLVPKVDIFIDEGAKLRMDEKCFALPRLPFLVKFRLSCAGLANARYERSFLNAARLIHTATISTRRPSANKARIMKLALISMDGVSPLPARLVGLLRLATITPHLQFAYPGGSQVGPFLTLVRRLR